VIPIILVIEPAPGLPEALRSVVRELDEVPRVEQATAKNSATAVASWRPFALVVPEAVAMLDPDELQALARDVHAEVILFDSQRPVADVATDLLSPLKAAFIQWELRGYVES
jgi:hypothetical protein